MTPRAFLTIHATTPLPPRNDRFSLADILLLPIIIKDLNRKKWQIIIYGLKQFI
jgi:hypothetical protein